MPNKIAYMSKTPDSSPVLTLVRGDMRSATLTLIVERYANGVDLLPLAWYMPFCNAAGEKSVLPLGKAQEIPCNRLALPVEVPGLAAATIGDTTFSLRGTSGGEDDPVVWGSADRCIRISSTLEVEPPYDPDTEPSEWQKWFGDLANVAQEAQEAADTANAAAMAADDAAGKANTAAGRAESAADNLRDYAGTFNGKFNEAYNAIQTIATGSLDAISRRHNKVIDDLNSTGNAIKNDARDSAMAAAGSAHAADDSAKEAQAAKDTTVLSADEVAQNATSVLTMYVETKQLKKDAETAAGAAEAARDKAFEAQAAAEAAGRDLWAAAERGDFNGKDGADGKDGAPGRDGVDGKDGKDGTDATVTEAAIIAAGGATKAELQQLENKILVKTETGGDSDDDDEEDNPPSEPVDRNKLNKDTFKLNTSVNTSGVEITANGYRISDYIETPNDITTVARQFANIALYDGSKNFISRTIYNGSYTLNYNDIYLEINTSSVSYIRVITNRYDSDTAFVYDGAYNDGAVLALDVDDAPSDVKEYLNPELYDYDSIIEKVKESIGSTETPSETPENEIDLSEYFTSKSINLLDGSKNTTGYGLSSSNGEPVKSASNGYTDFIDVSGNSVFTITRDFSYCCFYRADKSFVKRISLSFSTDFSTLNAEGAYIRLVFNTNPSASVVYNKDKAMVVGGSYSGEYIPFSTPKLKKSLLDMEFISENVGKDKKKTIVCFGDSIVAGYGNSGKGYVDLYAEKYGCVCHNNAVSGASIALVSGRSNVYSQITSALDQTADLCVIGGLTNDISALYPNGAIGTVSSGYDVPTLDITTFTDALEITLSKAKETWKHVVYVIPHKMSTRNTAGQETMTELVRSICKKWSVEVVDIYNHGGLNTYLDWMTDTYTSNNVGVADGTHPNENGYRMFYLPQIEPIFSKYLS